MPSPGHERLMRKLLRNQIFPNADLDGVRDIVNYTGSLFSVDEDITIEPITLGGVQAEWSTPPEYEDGATVFYLHGGGYIMGSVGTYRHLTGRLAKHAGARMVSVDYRLAPEHPYPAALDDAVNAYRALLDTGQDPAKLGVAGDSAGGGLTLAMLLRLRDEGVLLPKAAAVIAPWTDLTLSGESWRANVDADPLIKVHRAEKHGHYYYGGHDPAHPYLSPLFADLNGLPPMLVHVGSKESMLDDSVAFADKVRQAGVGIRLEIEPELLHVWHYYLGWFPEADDGLSRLGAFLRERITA